MPKYRTPKELMIECIYCRYWFIAPQDRKFRILCDDCSHEAQVKRGAKK